MMQKNFKSVYSKPVYPCSTIRAITVCIKTIFCSQTCMICILATPKIHAGLILCPVPRLLLLILGQYVPENDKKCFLLMYFIILSLSYFPEDKALASSATEHMRIHQTKLINSFEAQHPFFFHRMIRVSS